MDGDFAISSPVPKPRGLLTPVGLAEETFGDTEEMMSSTKRKKKSRLQNLKGRHEVTEGHEQNMTDESNMTSDMLKMDVSRISDREISITPEERPTHWSEERNYLDEPEEPSTPTSSRKKKHKGALARLKKEKTLNGSLSSLQSEESPDKHDAADYGKADDHTSQTKEIDSSFTAELSDVFSNRKENGARKENFYSACPTKSTETLRAAGQSASKTPKREAATSGIKDSEEEDQDAIEEQYKLQLRPNRDSHQSSFTKSSPKGFPQPKPSSSTPKRIAAVKSEPTMSKADSMPDISESVRSSKRTWQFVKDRIGAEELSENGLKKSLSTSSMNTLASGLHTVRISTARHKNFIVGQQNNTSSMLGASELDRTFPGRHISIFVGSWNMADRKELPSKIEDFLLPVSLEFVPDIFVISSQENSVDRKEWEVLLQETIGLSHVIYHSAQHGTLHIAVCMKRELIWYCSMAEEDTATVRAFAQFKTKGAVAISFMMFGTSFLFLSCHLTANEGNKSVRIRDYNSIKQTLKLPRAVVENPLQQVDSEVSKRFDCAFWAGDFNFRITKEKEQVHRIVKNEKESDNPDYSRLLEHEELTQAMVLQEVFQGFHEGNIRFPPTYKFVIGEDEYDEERIPSYTDRILYTSKKPNTVHCEKYRDVPELTYSDHKPVYGLYQVNLKPGRDTIPLSGGQFRRDVYVEAAKRRALRRVAADIKPIFQSPDSTNQSSVCSIS